MVTGFTVLLVTVEIADEEIGDMVIPCVVSGRVILHSHRLSGLKTLETRGDTLELESPCMASHFNI